MDAAHDNRRQLGQLMVDEGFLTLEQLSVALAEQDASGRPLGKVLVDLGFVSEGAVANALAEQHGGLLKTEFGISAGLHAVPADSALTSTTPEPLDRAARIEQLESTLRTVVNERDAFAQKANELQARSSRASQPDEAEVARVLAAAADRVAKLEAEVQARLGEAQAHEAEVARVTAAAVAHIGELETRLQAQAGAPAQPDEAEVARLAAATARIAQLEAEVARVTAAAAGRIAELEAALQARGSEAAQRDEAEIARVTEAAAARIAELETTVGLGATRISELEHEVAEFREQAERQLQDENAAAEAAVEHAHLLLTPSPSGYTLMEWPGPAPPSGTLLDVDGAGFAVLRVGVSPLPGSRLRCAFLERI